MRYDSVAAIIRNLNDAGVQYLVVGGLAVAAHGYVRFTADIDLLIGFGPGNAERAVATLKAMGYAPRAPVPIEEFADPAKRKAWVNEKGITVFSLFNANHPDTEIDMLVEDPLGFEQARAGAMMCELAEGVTAPMCSLADLIKLKELAGRPQDLLDIQKLSDLHRGTA